MNQNILQDLRWRYTSKQYDPQQHISEQDLSTLLEAIRLSASSINSQPWRFVVIESEAAKQRLHRTFEHKHQFNQKHASDASHIILFAHKPDYSRDDYGRVVDQSIADGRVSLADREQAFGGFMFCQANTDEQGNNASWTRAQLYLALGNALHTLARLRIDATPMEGIDSDAIAREFAGELQGYQCEVALALGYRAAGRDSNARLAKSRLPLNQIMQRI